MATIAPHEVQAHNSATSSDNKIHDDATAAQYGFAGGLVPGVDVYAYLCHAVVEAWGRAWLERGSAEVHFDQPVYDGRLIRVEVGGDVLADGEAAELRAVDPDGTVCATLSVRLPDRPPPGRPVSRFPLAALPAERPPASPEVFAEIGRGGALGSFTVELTATAAAEHLTEVREPPGRARWYRTEQLAHPAWLLRRANDVLMRNVVLGPWIHVASRVTHHGLVRYGDVVGVRSTVAEWYERRGHRFVELDLGLVVDEQVAASIHHTAIYDPRRSA